MHAGTRAVPLDTDFVRSRFPALSDEWALFDNAGGSVPLDAVIEGIHAYMSRWQVQLGASYRHSVAAAERVADGRRAMAELIGAAPDEIVLGPSSTANVRMLARALRPLWRPGDEIVVTNLDHETNVGAWRELESDGLVIREWRFDPERLELTLDGLDPLLGPRTRLVCFTHCSNIVGTVHDVAAIVRRVHAAGALACVDGVAFAPHRRVDVKALGADFYFFSLYKVYGPHLGLMYGRRDLLREAEGQNHFFVAEDDVPGKLEPGGVVHELVASLPAVRDYLVELGARNATGGPAGAGAALDRAFEAIEAHERELATPLLEFLAEHRDVRIVGAAAAGAARVPTISFTVAGRHAGEIPARLDAERVAVRFGHFYAWRAIETLGLLDHGGVVRASMVHYNTRAEVDRLVAALDRALRS